MNSSSIPVRFSAARGPRTVPARTGVDHELLFSDPERGSSIWSLAVDPAAALRMPPEVIGTGDRSVRDLIRAQSRRRSKASGGEASIPLDEVTEATVVAAGWALDDVLPRGTRLRVRQTANLHLGGTIHDVTAQLNPELSRVALAAAAAIDIPVIGIDLIVPDVTGDEYVFIEANERPGLANHEPQPTASAFLDFLFPDLPAPPQAWTPLEAPPACGGESPTRRD